MFNAQRETNVNARSNLPAHDISLKVHTAINNETFAQIASKYSVKVSDLCRWNAHLLVLGMLTSKSKC